MTQMHATTEPRKARKTSKRASCVWRLVGPVRRDATSPRNSMCGSARLADLDWSHWWTDGSSGELYLHVRRLHPDLDGTEEADATWHRVFCRQTDRPRLTVIAGKLFWLIDRPNDLDQTRGGQRPRLTR